MARMQDVSITVTVDSRELERGLARAAEAMDRLVMAQVAVLEAKIAELDTTIACEPGTGSIRQVAIRERAELSRQLEELTSHEPITMAEILGTGSASQTSPDAPGRTEPGGVDSGDL